MKLPFLKHKRFPRVAVDGPEPKTIEHGKQLDADSIVEEYCVKELMHAVENKDIRAFRAAIEALVLDCFEDAEEKEPEHAA